MGPFLLVPIYLMCKRTFCIITKSKVHNGIGGIRVFRVMPKVLHLFFANDTLIFTKAVIREYEGILEILNKYGAISGQCINFEKSSMLLSPNMSQQEKQ